jgi:hypothetical protein
MTAPVTLPRDDFLRTRFDYRTGDHVTILGPTQSGKTQLAYQLLAAKASPKVPSLVLCMKPRDATVSRWTNDIGLRLTRSWPPPPSPFVRSGVNGWTVWPKHTFDADKDDAMLERVFKTTLNDSYKRGNRKVFCDEVQGLVDELNLRRNLSMIWMRGASMGCGLWAASQRPANIPLHAYSQAEHLFLFNEPDKRGRERYGDIGGAIDPKVIDQTVRTLPEYHCLYIRRRGARVAVIGP